MRLGTWLYPWDVAELGPASVVADLEDLAVQTLSVAANYHPIASLSVRDRMPRLFHSSEGEVLFPCDGVFQGSEIVPRMTNRLSGLSDLWKDLSSRARSAGLTFDAWIVTIFQPWIARDYPATARVFPSGDLDRDLVCPLSAPFQSYLLKFVSHIAEIVSPDRMILENLLFPAYDYGWIRPRVLVRFPDRHRVELGVCFCEACSEAGRSNGVDVDGMRQAIISDLMDYLDSGVEKERSSSLTAELEAFMRMKESLLAKFIAELKGTIHRSASATECVLWAPGAVGSPWPTEMEWEWARLADGLIVQNDQTLSELRQLAASSGVEQDYIRLIWALSEPSPAEVSRLSDDIVRARSADIDEIALYNYGLVSDALFRKTVKVCRENGRVI